MTDTNNAPVVDPAHEKKKAFWGEANAFYNYTHGTTTTTDPAGIRTVTQQITNPHYDAMHASSAKLTINNENNADNGATIIQKNVNVQNKLEVTHLYGMGGVRIHNPLTDATIIQESQPNAHPRYNNVATLENANHLKLDQRGPTDDEVNISTNVENSTISQGDGGDKLKIDYTHLRGKNNNNQFDGGNSPYETAGTGITGWLTRTFVGATKDRAQFSGNRDDWSFEFNKDGSFTATHKKTGTTPGTFKNYEEVTFGSMETGIESAPISIEQLKTEEQAKKTASQLNDGAKNDLHAAVQQMKDGLKPNAPAIAQAADKGHTAARSV